IAGCRGGYPGALLAEIVGPDRVVVVETDEERRTRASRRLQAAGFEAVRVLPALPPETFDRILVLDATPPRQLVPLLADPAFLIARGRGVHDLAFVKLVRQGGETVQMTFTEAPSDVMAGSARSGDIGPVDFGRLFAVEDLLAHAWEGRVTGHYDQHFRDIVDETFAQGPLDPSAFDQAAEPCTDAPRHVLHVYGASTRSRVYIQKGLREKARTARRQALDVNHEYEPAQQVLRRIERQSGYFG